MNETNKPAEKPAPFSVNLWGSHPEDENDDCWTGVDFDTLAAAKAWLDAPVFPAWSPSHTVAYMQLVRDSDESGAGYVEEIEVRRNPAYDTPAAKRTRRQDDSLDRSEAQWQAAMSHGVQGWNDWEGC